MTKKQKKGSFPRITLAASIKVIKEAGQIKGPIAKETFAQFGARQTKQPSITSGAFNDKLNALKSFGLISINGDNIELTNLAIKIIDPLDTKEEQNAQLQCFNNIESFKELLEHLKPGVPIKESILQEQAVNTIGVVRSQREKFVNYFINAADRVGLISRVDKETIKRKEGNLDEAFQATSTPSNSLTNGLPDHSSNICDDTKNTYETNSNTELTLYPYSDSGTDWKIEIKIYTRNPINRDIRQKRTSLADMLEDLNTIEE